MSHPVVRLRELQAAEFGRLAESPGAFAASAGFRLGRHAAVLQAVATEMVRFLERKGIVPPWGGYLALDPESRMVLGSCGFKGPPDSEDSVEIAYFTLPGGEGKGIGTAMARALVAIASGQPRVRRIRAHTLPERNASSRILVRTGFRCLGEVLDPEDGPVWRWEREPMPGGEV